MLSDKWAETALKRMSLSFINSIHWWVSFLSLLPVIPGLYVENSPDVIPRPLRMVPTHSSPSAHSAPQQCAETGALNPSWLQALFCHSRQFVSCFHVITVWKPSLPLHREAWNYLQVKLIILLSELQVPMSTITGKLWLGVWIKEQANLSLGFLGYP